MASGCWWRSRYSGAASERLSKNSWMGTCAAP
jgi:hypothetical protein